MSRPSTPAIGHDLVDIPRFRRALERRPGAWQRKVFTEGEWEAAGRRPDAAAVLAARFAAKEAAMKALGTGWGGGVSWRDVEVLGGGRTAPRLHLTGEAARRLEGRSMHLSLSHAGDVASAVVLLWP